MCSSCKTWTVTYPPESGRAPEVKPNSMAARTAAAKVPGATYAPTTPATAAR